MRRILFIFGRIYAVAFAVAGVIAVFLFFTDDTLDGLKLWLGLVLEGGFILIPFVFVIACLIAAVWTFFSKKPADGS